MRTRTWFNNQTNNAATSKLCSLLILNCMAWKTFIIQWRFSHLLLHDFYMKYLHFIMIMIVIIFVIGLVIKSISNWISNLHWLESLSFVNLLNCNYIGLRKNTEYLGVSEWLLFNANFSATGISWREQVNFQWDDDEVCFVLDQNA